MLTAYFDESGIHKGDHLCVVAGFVGNEAQWASFIHDWLAALRPRPLLHMRKLRWNQHPDRIAPLLARLGPIPYRYNLIPVYCGMWQKDYEEIMKGKVREKFTTPYITCAQSCMAIALGELAGPDEVQFVFERQRVNQSAMENLRSVVFGLVGVDSRVRDIIFRPAREMPCLEPADYLAFQLREWKLDPHSVKATMGMSILGANPHGGIYTREQIKQKTDELIAFGLVPGGPPSKPTRELFRQLMNNPYFRGPQSRNARR